MQLSSMATVHLEAVDDVAGALHRIVISSNANSRGCSVSHSRARRGEVPSQVLVTGADSGSLNSGSSCGIYHWSRVHFSSVSR